MEGFTKRQVDGAIQARQAYHAAGAPDLNKFKLAVRSGFFKNFPLTEADIKNAETIFGPSVSVLKGKTKRPSPDSVVEDWVEIPPEVTMHNQKLDLAFDLAFINNAVILTTIDLAIKFRYCVPIKNRTKGNYLMALMWSYACIIMQGSMSK